MSHIAFQASPLRMQAGRSLSQSSPARPLAGRQWRSVIWRAEVIRQTTLSSALANEGPRWPTFHYGLCLLHHPGYRTKYADNLKRELPRIPFASEFRPFAKAGEKLAKLHLDYEKLKPWEVEFVETPGVPLSYRIEDKMRLSKDKLRLAVNPSLTLAGIPPEVYEYRLGNRSALEWVIDQYQVSTDKRSGITSDPNREDDPEYIVRLVGQVVRVSIETVRIVNGLPAEFEPK
jgi:predicted helicase